MGQKWHLMQILVTSRLFFYSLPDVILRIWDMNRKWLATFLPWHHFSLQDSRLRPSPVRTGGSDSRDSRCRTSSTCNCCTFRLGNMAIPDGGGREAMVHLQPRLQEGIECRQRLAHLQLSPYQHPPFWKYLHGCIETGRSCRYLHLEPNLQPPFMKYLRFESLKTFSMCTALMTE